MHPTEARKKNESTIKIFKNVRDQTSVKVWNS